MPLAMQLAQMLVTDTRFVIVTGGLVSKTPGGCLATDGAVLEGAREGLKRAADTPHSRIVTVLPEHDRAGYKRSDLGNVVRIPHADPRTRRHSMVLTSDVVVTIGGGKATKEVLDLAYVAGKPFLPIPSSGGSSRESWDLHQRTIMERFRISSQEARDLSDSSDLPRVASVCLALLKRVLRPRCFVAMPFDRHPVPLAFETIRRAVDECGYETVRVDQGTFSGSIVDAIWDEIRRSDAAVVDLTDHRPNVYYELGIAHALSKPALLIVYSQDGRVPSNIPFDIRVQRVLPFGTEQSLQLQLLKHLPDLRTGGGAR